MKRRFCTILMAALLVLPAASPGVAQEATPPAPQGWRAPPEERSLAPPEDRDLEGWEPPPPPTAPGAVITVTTTDDELNSDGDCALREAIEAANLDAAVDACTPGSGADTVLVPAGTYLLTIPGAGENYNQTGDLDVRDHLTLTGDGADLTILDGNNLDRVLHMWLGLTVEINALTVTHGQVVDVQGGGILNQGTLTLNDVSLLENTVISNLAYGGAGLANGAWSLDSSATLNGCLVDGNTGPNGVGIANAAGTGHTATVTVNDSTVSNNTATKFAGGLYNGYYGGATDTQSYLTLTDSLVAANSALGMGSVGGGGIVTLGVSADNIFAWLTLERTTVRDNMVTNEPGLRGGTGAGVLIEETTTTVLDSTISDNVATGVGDVQPALGGGMAIWDSDVTLSNSTVSGNQVLGEAGGSGVGGAITLVSYYAPASLTLLNVTLAGNSADVEGGAIQGANVLGLPVTLTFKNTLIGGNTAPTYPSCGYADFGYGPPEFTSLGHNLEDHDLCEFDQPTDWPNTDGLLGPLQDNGGPTWTHALLAGSPAIDAGDDDAAPPTDQRGVPRPQGPASDIGSYEANILVNTCDDELNSDGDCSLREAIEAANTDTAVDACMAGSGHDYLTLPACTYTLAIPGANEDNNQTGDLDILDDLTIYGSGAETTVIDGNQIDRVLHILDCPAVEVNDLAIANGRVIDEHGGGIFNARSNLTLNDAILRENEVVSTGGTLGGGALINSARYGGDATTTLNSCLVIENTAYGGGGLVNGADTGLTATLTLSNTMVVSNTAEFSGGGIWQTRFTGATDAMASLNLHNSVVEGNTAQVAGGGIDTSGVLADNVVATLTLDDSTIRENTATSNGDGLGNGGGIYAVDSTVTVVGSTISDNNSSGEGFNSAGNGGGIYAYGGTVTVVDSTISDNSGSGVGFETGWGGGLFLMDSPATLVNSTVSGNEASGSGLPDMSGGGGGIAIAGATIETSLTLTNTSVVSNTSNVAGGGIVNANYGADSVTTFKNSLVAGNKAPAGMGENCINPDVGFGQGTLTSLGHNLEDYDTCEFDQPSDWPNTDPLLGPLQDNGGPTWTHALLEGSLARDHGDDAACPPADQRGVPRPQGPHCDIGSFEAYPDENPPAVMAVSPPHEAADVALDATVVITFSEPISVPTFAYSLSPDPGGWSESWGPNHTVVSLTHDAFAYGTMYTAIVTAAEDRAGNPMTAPYAWSFTTVACDPVEAVTVEGPADLLVGETGVYTAAYTPLTATLPVTLTWEDGTVGATAAYSWTLPGTYTLAVTATNPCSEVSGAFTVAVCQPVAAAMVEGPAALGVGETGVYTAAYTPLTATLPVTLTWGDGTVGATAAYSWTLPGTYTLTVTATNPCGEVSGTFPVVVSSELYWIFLPLVVKDMP